MRGSAQAHKQKLDHMELLLFLFFSWGGVCYKVGPINPTHICYVNAFSIFNDCWRQHKLSQMQQHPCRNVFIKGQEQLYDIKKLSYVMLALQPAIDI